MVIIDSIQISIIPSLNSMPSPPSPSPPPPWPYPRRRFIEFHEQPFTPSWIRQPVQTLLMKAWVTQFWPIQNKSPAGCVVEVLEGVLGELAGKVTTGKGKGKDMAVENDVRVIDFCSGGGGPVPTIEKLVNTSRKKSSLPPIPFLLTDLHPHPSAWEKAVQESKTGGLSFVEEGVDATDSPSDLGDRGVRVRSSTKLNGEGYANANGNGNGNGQAISTSSLTNPPPSSTTTRTRQRNLNQPPPPTRTLRTFFLAFHHFPEDLAIKVLQDGMLNSDSIAIFELQKFDVGSLWTVTMLGAMSWVVTPFVGPSLVTLIFTYLIPIIPFILVFDGYISAYRTRSFSHIKHLASIAEHNISTSSPPLSPTGGTSWIWTEGSMMHTWPGGKVSWIVGKRVDL